MATFRLGHSGKNTWAANRRTRRYEVQFPATPPPPWRELSDAIRRDRTIRDLIRRDGDRCYICGTTLDEKPDYHLEHIVARSNGGTDHPSNLALACQPCNYRKGTRYISFAIRDRTPVLSL